MDVQRQKAFHALQSGASARAENVTSGTIGTLATTLPDTNNFTTYVTSRIKFANLCAYYNMERNIMPILGGLHVLIALFFAIHVFKHRRALYWLIALFSLPFLGSAIYLFAIYLPKSQYKHSIPGTTLLNLSDPTHEVIRETEKTPTLTHPVSHHIRLGDVLLDAGVYEAALLQYRQAADGPDADNPTLLAGLAKVWLELHAPTHALAALEKLFDTHPQKRQQPDLALLFSRALAGSGSERSPNTRAAFDLALKLSNSPEVKCHYADWLTQGSDTDRAQARALYEEVISDRLYRDTRHARERNRKWLAHAEQALASN